MRQSIALLALVALLPAALLALPFEIRDPSRDPVAEKPEETFARSDKDQSGGLTFDEFLFTDLPYVQLKHEEFDGLDADHDGTITRAEYETHFQRQKQNVNDLRAEYFGQLYDQFDEDFDLKLSEEEVRNVLAKRFLLKPRDNFHDIFLSYDKNHDGGLDLDEYIQFDGTMPFQELDPLNPAELVPEKAPVPALYKQDKLPMMKKLSSVLN